MPTPPFATSRAGKPVQVDEGVTIVGRITGISGTGPTATITVLLTSGGSVSVTGLDVYSKQTS
jgi:hypothetical protein